MNSRELTLLFGFAMVLGLTLIAAAANPPTGAVQVATYTGPDDEATGVKALRLHDRALDFFNTKELIFPKGVCMPAAHELYGNVAYVPIDVSAGFSTSGTERFSTISFVIDRHERYGTADFVKSPTFLKDQQSDALISISSEAIVRVPKADRTTYLIMDLYGLIDGPYMFVNKGRFSTPTTDCIFVVNNGQAYCDCDIHTIKGIAIGGVTAPPPAEDRYKELEERSGKEVPKQP